MTPGDRIVSRRKPVQRLPVLGWREWVALPDLGVEWIKVKVDTGARTSSLHAFALQQFERGGRLWARFGVHPWQRSAMDALDVEAPVIDVRAVRSSSGRTERRPVIRTRLAVGGLVRPIELTLTRRDEMGFRMLLGREATRRRFLVDPGSSYLGGKPDRAARRRNARTEVT